MLPLAGCLPSTLSWAESIDPVSLTIIPAVRPMTEKLADQLGRLP
jgi:hypothetical protein